MISKEKLELLFDKKMGKFIKKISTDGMKCYCCKGFFKDVKRNLKNCKAKDKIDLDEEFILEEYEKAKIVFNWLSDKKFEDGSYWMGVTFPDAVVWPEERTAWTTAAVLLAYDALNHLTPACRIFNHSFWDHSCLAETS